MRDYQEAFVDAVRRLIAANWLRRRPEIRILDMGCDPSGKQLKEISHFTRGEVVGINIAQHFPSESAKAAAGPRVRLQNMSGMALEFPRQSFDLVISANVIEHVPDPVKFIQEASRVLKPNGICYMETAPVWTGPRGHHVMECMVAENCPWETQFRDDGSIIPDWSHLSLTREQMEQLIGDKIDPKTKRWILSYLYDSDDLNKTSWKTIEAAFLGVFSLAKIHKNPLPSADLSRKPIDGLVDYMVYGFSAVCRQTPQNFLAKRINWRLRKIGL